MIKVDVVKLEDGREIHLLYSPDSSPPTYEDVMNYKNRLLKSSKEHEDRKIPKSLEKKINLKPLLRDFKELGRDFVISKYNLTPEELDGLLGK